MPNDQPYQQTATNPKTGERFGYNGSSWVSINPPKKQAEPAKEQSSNSFPGSFSESFGMPANIKDWPKTLSQLFGNPSPYDPTGGALTAAGRLVKGTLQAHGETAQRELDAVKNAPSLSEKLADYAKYVESGIPGIGPSLVKAGEQVGAGKYAGAAGTTAGVATQLLGADLVKPEAEFQPYRPPEPKPEQVSGVHGILNSIVNEGPTREKMQRLQDYDALSTRDKIATLDKAVKADATNLLDKTSKAIDQKFPEGSIDGGAVAQGIRTDLPQYVKAKTLRTKLPAPLQKILDEAGGTGGSKAPRALSQSELGSLTALTREGLKGDQLRSGLTNLGYTPRQVDAMMSTAQGASGSSVMWGFEQAKQLRTDLADEIFSSSFEKYPAPIKKVTIRAWQDLTKQLDAAADKAGMSEDWSRGKQKYTNYRNDFHGSWDAGKYNSSPLRKAMQGQTADDIMGPLSDKSASQSKSLLDRYQNFGVDTGSITKDVRRFNLNKKIMRFASPNKWDILVGGMILYGSPAYAIPAFLARYGVPRMAENLLARRADTIPAARFTPTTPE